MADATTLLEVMRTPSAYLALGRGRVRFVLNTALVVLMGNMTGLWFRKCAPENVLLKSRGYRHSGTIAYRDQPLLAGVDNLNDPRAARPGLWRRVRGNAACCHSRAMTLSQICHTSLG